MSADQGEDRMPIMSNARSPRPKLARAFLITLGSAAFVVLVPTMAQAHVKWFAPYDLAVAPTPPTLFLHQGALLLCLVLSVPVLWLVIGVDHLDRRLDLLSHAGRILNRLAPRADNILRVTIGVWLTWLWALPTPVFLTPELIAPTAHIQWLQLLISVFCISRRTSWIAGAGLLLLYIAGIGHYGLFHLADYPIFLGLAAYLVGISVQNWRCASLRQLASHRQSILVVTVAATLCWASIEKWAFASWTTPLLTDRPYLAMGFDSATFMALAGWVEFGLAILLVIGGRLTSRLAALVLLAMFGAAVFEFGRLDLVGHLPIMASLVLVITVGNSAAGGVASLSARRLFTRLLGLPVLYFAALALAITAYFGGWEAAYGETSRLVRESALDASLVAVGIITILGAIGVAALFKSRSPMSRVWASVRGAASPGPGDVTTGVSRLKWFRRYTGFDEYVCRSGSTSIYSGYRGLTGVGLWRL